MLKILSLNIHKGFNFSRSKYTLEALRKQLRVIHPDIVFLQEVTGHFPTKNHRLNGDSPLEALADELWDYQAYGKNAIYSKGHHGNAILSKFAFDQFENINISTNRFESRGLLHGIVRIKGQPLHLLCLHLNLLEGGRRKQIEIIRQRIESCVPADQAMIIAGDFNDWRKNVDQVFLEKMNLKEAFCEVNGQHARTFPNFMPILPLDRMYLQKVSAKNARVLGGKNWQRLSDHLPILVELGINP